MIKSHHSLLQMSILPSLSIRSEKRCWLSCDWQIEPADMSRLSVFDSQPLTSTTLSLYTCTKCTDIWRKSRLWHEVMYRENVTTVFKDVSVYVVIYWLFCTECISSMCIQQWNQFYFQYDTIDRWCECLSSD